MISPSGVVNEAFAQPGWEFDYTPSGNWGEYINDAWGECGEWSGGMCMYYDILLTIPVNELELGTYESSFIVTDNKISLPTSNTDETEFAENEPEYWFWAIPIILVIIIAAYVKKRNHIKP